MGSLQIIEYPGLYYIAGSTDGLPIDINLGMIVPIEEMPFRSCRNLTQRVTCDQQKNQPLAGVSRGEHRNSSSFRWWLHAELVDPFQAVVESLPTLDK